MIRAETQMQTNTAKLSRAILVYEGEQTFATIHPVQTLEQDPRPFLGAGELLNTAQVASLTKSLWQQKLEFVTENIIAIGLGEIAWFVPSERHAMFFETDDESLKAISGKVFNHPSLLFVASRQHLYVYALADNTRPTPKTQLYQAPYYNLFKNHRVCIGSMKVPTQIKASSVETYAQNFFASKFTRGYVKLLKTGGSYSEFWQTQISEGQFPTKALIPLQKTLEQVLGAQNG